MTLDAATLDARDPLAGHRDRFVGAESELVYLDGNSLGRPLRATAERIGAFVAEEWGGRLIRGWDEGWFDLPLTLGDRIGEVVLGAAPGQAAVGDSTTVLLYKLVRAAVAAQPGRDEIVVDRDNFPTDRYVVEGVAAECGLTVRWIETDPEGGVGADDLAAVLGPRTALVVLSHVAYRSGWLADVAELTRLAHDAGAWILLDLCHSAGVVPLELDSWGVDLAVGCSYKYLNGGPGAPAFGYVAARHLESGAFVQPIQGWMGAAEPFTMGPEYAPATGIRRLLSGTPPIVGMLGLADMVELIAEVGVPAVREKSVALTELAVALAERELPEVRIASPRDPDRRGGHVTLAHPRMRAVTAALWQRDVLPDFRQPDGLRIGLSPLSTSFTEVERGIAAIRAAL
ncbi:aminotransferase class V-fold PLP-dependent enzyme [Nocardioides sp. zg-536]|uniref:Kynureninase n=1 Tax=Nocardioides faecalis TaxID=2803858 RepID=A0A938XYK5_9ACTN|nr:aminotransferase class V-fold PLP-dependent enzyme [Nocardioides faecalis]MBM9458852.1 aminotransferase class V-fold PLP-dependent enzyme [Nocardioides faecalis]QVI60258.1 aminotransferase class V-fold PLP-dependent enzyme [Nocardioides faecalis]